MTASPDDGDLIQPTPKIAVPDEVADDFRVYADFWGDYAEIFADIDFSDPDTFQDPDVLAAFDNLDSEALDEAQANIDAWITENC